MTERLVGVRVSHRDEGNGFWFWGLVALFVRRRVSRDYDLEGDDGYAPLIDRVLAYEPVTERAII
jgi:hypothetical protein